MSGVTVLWVALAAFFAVRTIRIVRPVSDWVARGLKPWACNNCLSFWACLLFTALAAPPIAPWAVVQIAASAGICLLLLELTESAVFRPSPPMFPPDA